MDISQKNVPIFNVPRIVVAVIALLIAIHLYRESLTPIDEFHLTALGGFVPARLGLAVDWLDLEQLARGFTEIPNEKRPSVAYLSVLFLKEDYVWLSFLSYSGLHGDWSHVLLNSLWFLAFGSVVARRLGAMLFLIFFSISAIGAALVYAAANPLSIVPMIGASGVVSAAMGAALLLPFEPMQEPGALDSARGAPLMPLSIAIRDRRVVTTTIVWFATNALLAFGFNPGPGASEATNIAWEAHIGGYVIGMLLLPILDRFKPETA